MLLRHLLHAARVSRLVQRAFPLALLLLAFAALQPQNRAMAAEALSPAQKSEVERTVHDYILAHPEVILQAVESLRQQQKQAEVESSQQTIAANKQALRHDPASFVAGNPNGDVTIVEFFDYRCPYCKQMVSRLDQLTQQDGRIRLVLKELPVLGPDSLLASRAAIAAMAQGKYKPLHDAMMQSRGTLSESVIMRLATDAGLDTQRLKTGMDDPQVAAVLQANRQMAEQLGINGTPGFIIGDNLVPGAVDIDQLQALVADARKQCRTC